MKRLLALSFIVIISLSTYGQALNTAKIDSLFNNLSENNLAIGSIAVFKDGKPVYQRSFGKDQSSSTEYRIGSISKVFTAVLIYQLIDRGKLSLKDTLSEYFPDLANAGRITIAEMLGHRSGLANFTNNTDYDTWKDQPKTHEQLLAMIKGQKPDFEPNQKADYNNSNYLLLSYIIEKIYKRPYKDVVTERIINKLGLKNTYYGDHAGFIGNEAISYKYFNNQWQKDRAVYIDNFSGAGAIISTSPDMCKFIIAIFANKLFSKNSLAQMTHIVDGYGMGMFPYGNNAHPGFGHNGKTEGFASSIQYYPENKLAIAYCTNGEVYSKAQILDDVFNICFNLPCKIPGFKPVTVSDTLLNKYTGTYISGSNGMQVVSAKDGGEFTIEAKGQKFNLIAISNYEFWNVQYGFFFEFNNEGKQLLIKDVDDVYWLDKK